MKKSTIFVTSIITIATVSASLFWIFKKNNHIDPYKTEPIIKRDLTQYVTATGTLKVTEQISVGSLITGKVIEIKANDNDNVKKGQVLAVLDNGIGDSAVKRLKALLEIAKAQANYQKKFYEREEALYKSGQRSRNLFEQYTQDYIVAQERAKQAEAELEIEQKTFQNLFITSPDDGVIIAKKIDLGQMVVSQLNATVLFEIGKNFHEMEANIDIDESDIGMVAEGQTCIFRVDAFPKEKFNAVVKRIQYQAKVTDNVVTYATVLDVKNPELKLRPGMTSNVEINVAEVKDVLSVPNKALRVSQKVIEEAATKCGYLVKALNQDDAKTCKLAKPADMVWALRAHKSVEQLEVQLGVNNGKYSQVLSGLNQNDRVIIDVDLGNQPNPLMNGMFARPGQIGK